MTLARVATLGLLSILPTACAGTADDDGGTDTTTAGTASSGEGSSSAGSTTAGSSTSGGTTSTTGGGTTSTTGGGTTSTGGGTTSTSGTDGSSTSSGGADESTGTATTTEGGDETTDETGSVEPMDCEFDAGVEFSRLAETYQLISDDQTACVVLHRRDDSEPDIIYKAVPFTLLDFFVRHDQDSELIDELDALTWESTHHNWNDVGEAVGPDVRYRLEDWYTTEEGGEAYTDKFGLLAYEAGTSTVLWGPILLRPWSP